MYSSVKNNYGCFIVPLDVIHLTFMALDNMGKNIEYVSEVGLPQGSWGEAFLMTSVMGLLGGEGRGDSNH
jgi:hypothetical protein